MSLEAGARLGPYAILAPLGAGGMGEVYRATDTRLGRDVALKLLPGEFAADPERLARFEREAKLLASLSHPNIATLFGLEEMDGRRVLAMELVLGEDLAARLKRGPIPVEDAIPIAKQVAEALEEAHEKGIVHRDLKPANVKVTPDGKVKVLDFGLAKAWSGERAGATSSADLSQSPTLAHTGTAAGLILGTAAYMAPEQARGRAVDRRADIWAFGVVLFEMLTGRRLFEGETVSDVLAGVLKTEPDWTLLPPATPPFVARLLRRCLERDPHRRLRDIGEARLLLEEGEPAAAEPATTARPSPWSRLWPALAGAILTAAAAALLWPRPGPAPQDGGALTRLSALAPPGTSLYPDSAQVALSPDGRMVAFVTGDETRVATRLWVRSLDSPVARRVDEGGGAALPFWSPDSRLIAFFSDDKLVIVPASGGRAEPVCAAPNARGGAWSPSNVIVLAPDVGGPLYRVSPNGGEPAPVTTLDPARNEYGHRFPAFLPDGDHFLFAALPGRAGKFDIFVGSLRDGSRTLVGAMPSAPVYADPGWLLFARRGALAAQPFDAGKRQLTGEAVSLEDEPTSILDPAFSFTAGHPVSVSSVGSLAYYSAPSIPTTPTWLDAGGRVAGALDVPPARYSTVRVSPDGTRAVLVRSDSPTESGLWLADLVRGGVTRLSTGPGLNDSPVWSPDGTRVVFASDRDGPQDLYVKVVGDAAPEQPLHRSPVMFKSPDGWSPDGRWIVFQQLDPDTKQNVWLLPASGEAAPRPYVRTPGRDFGAAVSPDGRWLAYVSEESGRSEVYVQSFPVPGQRAQASTAGATSAWWTPDGRRLLFLSTDATSLWGVDVTPGAALRLGTPTRTATVPAGFLGLDAMPDRQRWLATLPERGATGSVIVVQSWRAALGRGR